MRRTIGLLILSFLLFLTACDIDGEGEYPWIKVINASTAPLEYVRYHTFYASYSDTDGTELGEVRLTPGETGYIEVIGSLIFGEPYPLDFWIDVGAGRHVRTAEEYVVDWDDFLTIVIDDSTDVIAFVYSN